MVRRSVDRGAHQGAEPQQHVERLLVGVHANERCDRVQCVEKKVRLNVES